jgi:hypothetical protein
MSNDIKVFGLLGSIALAPREKAAHDHPGDMA